MLRVAVLSVLVASAMASKSKSKEKSDKPSKESKSKSKSDKESKSHSHSHSHSKSKSHGRPPKQCAFGCDSDCVKCTGRTTLDDGRQEVTVDVGECKGSCLSWICARNEGAELVECGDECGGDGSGSKSRSKSKSKSKSHSHSHSHSHSKGGKGSKSKGKDYARMADVLSHSKSKSKGRKSKSSRSGGGRDSSTKCEETDGATYVLPGDQTTLTLQVHDGRLGGDVMCASKGDCCGGSGSSCAESGVCNFEVDLSTCPGDEEECPECGTVPAVVRTVGPDNGAVEEVAEVSALAQFMPGWQVNGQQFYLYGGNLPTAPTKGFFPTQPVAAGSTIEVTCPCNAENKPCEVVVVHYHCPFCTATTNGGLPLTLPGLGWRPGRCGPQISQSAMAPGNGWSTLAFRKLVASGATEEVPVADDVLLEHVGVFVRQCAVDCELVDPMGAVPDECVCAPDNGPCQSGWCPRPRPGPPGPPGMRKPCQEEPGCAPSSVMGAGN